MDCFNNFDPLISEVTESPFFELGGIVHEARLLLTGISAVGIRNIERDLDDLIYDEKQGLASYCLDEHVEQVIDEACWELKHLPDGTLPTSQSVRHLFENWPKGVRESLYLTEDDFTDVETLRMVVSYGGTDRLNSQYEYPVHCAAVLALMKAAGCLETLKCTEADLGKHEEGPIAARLVNAANDAIEAALALGLARELSASAEAQESVVKRVAEDAMEAHIQFSKERARHAAMAKHRTFKPAIEFVRTEWAKYREAYEFNKTAFARTYVKFVSEKFSDRNGDPLKVTIKTITNVWLSPSASRQAGELADG